MNKFIKTRAARILSRANELGLTDKNGKPLDIRQVAELVAADEGFRNVHAYDTALTNREAPALMLEVPDESGCDYKLINDYRGLWLTMNQYSVHVYFPCGDEGIIADIYNKGQEDNVLASAQVYHPDAEFALSEDLDVDLDDVAEWVGLHYQRNFEAEPAAKRVEWIQRFVEAHAEPKSQSQRSNEDWKLMRDTLETVGYTIDTDSDQPGKFVWYAPSDGCDVSFDSDVEAVQDAWTDATQQAKSILSLTDDQWSALPLAEQCQKISQALGESDDPADDDAFVCSVCGARHDIENSIQSKVGLICPTCEGSFEYKLAEINLAGPFNDKDQIRNIADSLFEDFDYGDRQVEDHNGWEWSGFGNSQHLSKTVFLKWKDEPEENDSHSESFSVTVKDGRIVDFG